MLGEWDNKKWNEQSNAIFRAEIYKWIFVIVFEYLQSETTIVEK